jgi:phage tail sheath gpL-like
MILREQTQYQLNSFGQADTAFGLLTILTTLQELLRRMKSAITTKYPRVKLVPDGTRLGPGQAAVQPIDIKAELISEFNAAMFDGLVSNLAAFKNNLVVEIDDNDPNRVNVLWPPQLAGQMRQFAALAQFRLMYPTAA